jgi:hypothetical protein
MQYIWRHVKAVAIGGGAMCAYMVGWIDTDQFRKELNQARAMLGREPIEG